MSDEAWGDSFFEAYNEKAIEIDEKDKHIAELEARLAEAERRQKYLSEHHHICETAIGIARLRLEHGNTDGAKQALDQASDRIDAAREERHELSDT